MRKTIVCNICKKEIRELHPSDNPYPGEHLKFVKGNTKKTNFCDHCGGSIKKHDSCWAYSVWSDKIDTYYPWEDEVLNISK